MPRSFFARTPHRLPLALAVMACTLSAPAHAQLFGRKPDPKPPVVLNAPGAALDGTKLFKAMTGPVVSAKRLVLGSFTVEFATEHGGGARSDNGEISTTQIVEVYLKDIDKAQLQAATDAAYAAFLEAAAKAGYEVVSKEQLLASPLFVASLAAGKASGLAREAGALKTLSYAPSGMAINGIGLAPSMADYAAGASNNPLSSLMAVANVAGSIGNALSSLKPLEGLGKSLGDANFLQVRLAVFFAEMKNEYGPRNSVMVSAKVGSKLGLYIDPRNTTFTLGTVDMGGWRQFQLSEALLVDGNPFTGSTDESPTGQNVALGVMNLLAGGKRSQKTNRYAIDVDSKVFGELATQALTSTAPLLLAALAADK
jgi:hypothetical protein